MRLGAVVVTYGSEDVLPGLLSTLEAHEPDVDLVVVDNASPSGPPAVDAPVRLRALGSNRGYGAASNAGWRELADTGVDLVAFLNPDVRLAGPSLTELATEMAERPNVGIATGPVMSPRGEPTASAWGETSVLRALWFAAGSPLPRTRRFIGRWFGTGPATSGASMTREELRVDGHVLGGAMVVRRDCFEHLGGFDEGFFLFWEDADLCYRAREAGWEIRVLPSTPFVHDAGTSSPGVTEDQRWGWYVEGAERFARKHLTAGQRWRLLTALRLGRRLRR